MTSEAPVTVQLVSVANQWRLACPVCTAPLEVQGTTASCHSCGAHFTKANGIWRCLPEARARQLEPFLSAYRRVRRDEGWGGDRAYYLALPSVPADDPQARIWRRRARSYQVLLEKVVEPAQRTLRRPLDVVDAGAGNCWLANRLTTLGHRVAAVDISDDEQDGLGAFRWYVEPGAEASFLCLEAELDRLPLAAAEADLVIFNASLHYSADCDTSLAEALRVLRPGGAVIVLDTPVYRDAGSGKQMLAERAAMLRQRYGVTSAGVAMEGFLTHDRLASMAGELGLQWSVLATSHPLRRPAGAVVRAMQTGRERAAMPVLVGRRV